MAIGDTPSQMYPSAGGGGSNWERNINNQDISTAKPVYNAATGQYEWQLPDGSRLTGNGAGQNGNSPYGWAHGLLDGGSSGHLRDGLHQPRPRYDPVVMESDLDHA